MQCVDDATFNINKKFVLQHKKIGILLKYYNTQHYIVFMHDPSHERVVFEDYTSQLFDEVNRHAERQSIEVETVFPRWKPNVAVCLSLRNHDHMIYCGLPTVERLDGNDNGDGNYLFLPSTECEFTDGIEVFGMVKLPNIEENVQYVSTKVYLALKNEKAGNIYHFFPSLHPSSRRSFIDNLSKVYATLIHTSEDLIPNYILKSVRSAGVNFRVANASSFRPVIKQLMQKAWDKEQRLNRTQLHARPFDSQDFECIYKRFKYLSLQPHSGVHSLKKSTSVDITVSRNNDQENNNTRISLYGQACFDTYCQLYKDIKSVDEIIAFISSLTPSECEMIKKKEMTKKDIKTLQDTQIYNGFKFNVKREDKISDEDKKMVLVHFFKEGEIHTYRYKKRFSFDCGGFKVDLTMVRKGKDKHPVFKPTPFVALEQMRKESDHYEFEIECNVSQKHEARQCLYWMDECLRSMRKDVYFFGKHIEPKYYPLFMDYSQTQSILKRFNQMPCHGDVKTNHSEMYVNTGVGPNVVNITHPTYSYVTSHLEDYSILVKTDGLRCVAYVDRSMQMIHLFIQNAKYSMSVKLSEMPRADYVFDGELYTQNDQSTYFIFDVYCKNQESLLTLPLNERFAAYNEELRTPHVSFSIQKKIALPLLQYNRLYTNAEDNEANREKMQAFECYTNGSVANDDGFILMHNGAIVSDVKVEEEEDIIKLNGSKPYIMRHDEFVSGKHSVNAMSRKNPISYIFCLKWKPEEECTIDFKIKLADYDASVNGSTRKVFLCSKYNDDSELNMYTILRALSSKRVTDALCPHTLPNKIQPFQPSEAYDYELKESVSNGCFLSCESGTGRIFTQRNELIHDGAIVEMRYQKNTHQWYPLRVRSDKTEPNLYTVALANWKNIFNAVPEPLKWSVSSSYSPDILTSSYYQTNKQVQAFSQVDNIHLLLKQHLILKSSKVLSNMDQSARLKVYEVGCGKGTDLFHWNFVHKHIREIVFYMGTDYDKNGLIRHDGAYYRYLRGEHGHTNSRIQTLDNKYEFNALFAQADARASLQLCRDQHWNNADENQRVSKFRLHYDILRYVLFGKAPENTSLANTVYEGFVHPTYNIVSCQMALHYFTDMKHFFWKNLNMILSMNGLFVATVPNGDFIHEQLQQSEDNKYVVPIRDAKSRKIIPWYVYEKGTTSNSVYFQTPKISRSEEPLFTKAKLMKAIKTHFHLLYFDTFAHYTKIQKLNIYQTSTDAKGVFHADSIDRQTLQHDFKGKYAKLSQTVQDTKDALQYSQHGHYVVILCKKNGYSDAEMDALKEVFTVAS